MKQKKSQMEIMGVAIIVVLLILGLLLFLRFSSVERPATLKEPFQRAELASSTLNTLLRTTTGCGRSSVAELYQDCVGPQKIFCENSDGEKISSCEYANGFVRIALMETIGELKRHYDFRVSHGSDGVVVYQIGDCGNFVDKDSSRYIIAGTEQHIAFTLDICG